MKVTPKHFEIADYIKRNPGRTVSDISSRFLIEHKIAKEELLNLCELKILIKEKKLIYYFYAR